MESSKEAIAEAFRAAIADPVPIAIGKTVNDHVRSYIYTLDAEGIRNLLASPHAQRVTEDEKIRMLAEALSQYLAGAIYAKDGSPASHEERAERLLNFFDAVLESGPLDINQPSRRNNGRTLLSVVTYDYLRAHPRLFPVLRSLMKHGAKAEIPGEFGSPLAQAIRGKNPAVLQLFAEFETDFRQPVYGYERRYRSARALARKVGFGQGITIMQRSMAGRPIRVRANADVGASSGPAQG